MSWHEEIDWIVDGEPVRASVINRPIKQLYDNMVYLRGMIGNQNDLLNNFNNRISTNENHILDNANDIQTNADNIQINANNIASNASNISTINNRLRDNIVTLYVADSGHDTYNCGYDASHPCKTLDYLFSPNSYLNKVAVVSEDSNNLSTGLPAIHAVYLYNAYGKNIVIYVGNDVHQDFHKQVYVYNMHLTFNRWIVSSLTSSNCLVTLNFPNYQSTTLDDSNNNIIKGTGFQLYNTYIGFFAFHVIGGDNAYDASSNPFQTSTFQIDDGSSFLDFDRTSITLIGTKFIYNGQDAYANIRLYRSKLMVGANAYYQGFMQSIDMNYSMHCFLYNQSIADVYSYNYGILQNGITDTYTEMKDNNHFYKSPLGGDDCMINCTRGASDFKCLNNARYGGKLILHNTGNVGTGCLSGSTSEAYFDALPCD